MALAERRLGVRLLPHDLRELDAEFFDHRRLERIRQRVDRAAGSSDLLHLIVARARLGHLRARRRKLGVDLGQHLLVDELAGSADDSVLLLERLDVPLGRLDLLAQLVDIAVEIGLFPARDVAARVGLVGDVGFGHRVGEPRGFSRIPGDHRDLHHIGPLRPLDRHRLRQRAHRRVDRLRVLLLAAFRDAEHDEDRSQQARLRRAEFRIVLEVLAIRRPPQHGFGGQELHLAVDERAVAREGIARAVRLGERRPRLQQHHGGRREQRRRDDGVKQRGADHDGRDQRDQSQPAAKRNHQFAEALRLVVPGGAH